MHCNVITLYLQHIIQMVITHTVLYPYVHTWHMHGYRFAVLKVVYPVKDNVTGLIHTRCKLLPAF